MRCWVKQRGARACGVSTELNRSLSHATHRPDSLNPGSSNTILCHSPNLVFHLSTFPHHHTQSFTLTSDLFLLQASFPHSHTFIFFQHSPSIYHISIIHTMTDPNQSIVDPVANNVQPAKTEDDDNKVFAGNLAFATTEQELKSLFSEAGKV